MGRAWEVGESKAQEPSGRRGKLGRSWISVQLQSVGQL